MHPVAIALFGMIVQESAAEPARATFAFDFEQGWKFKSTVGLVYHDPLTAAGVVSLDAKGRPTFRFHRIRYWDATQQWTIELGDRVFARNLTVERWRGTRAQWRTKLAEMERLFFEHYARNYISRMISMVRSEMRVPSAPDSGRSLVALLNRNASCPRGSLRYVVARDGEAAMRPHRRSHLHAGTTSTATPSTLSRSF